LLIGGDDMLMAKTNLGWQVIKPAFWTAPAKRSGDAAFFAPV
jgi:hypothetical protein